MHQSIRKVWALLAAVSLGTALAACGAGRGVPAAAPRAATPVLRSLPEAVSVRHALAAPAVRTPVAAAGVTVPVAVSAAESEPPPGVHVASSTLLAVLTGSIDDYAYPGAPPSGVIPGTWYGYQTVLPVIQRLKHWSEVRLAQRPNQSVTWIHNTDVDFSSTPYFLVLDLSIAHIEVFRSGVLIGSFPAGIGTATDPTPTGDFFVAFQAPPPSPGYGPLVLVTSAHSDTITDWEEGGDAIVAIHGPITAYADEQIGSTGAAISHGCIRLHDDDLGTLGGLPAGTPLVIVNG